MMTYSPQLPISEKELGQIEERLRWAEDGFPRDKLVFHCHAYRDTKRLLAALRQATKQRPEPLSQAAPALLAALELAMEEIAHVHADRISVEEPMDSCGIGWARVCRKGKAAINMAKGQST